MQKIIIKKDTPIIIGIIGPGNMLLAAEVKRSEAKNKPMGAKDITNNTIP